VITTVCAGNSVINFWLWCIWNSTKVVIYKNEMCSCCIKIARGGSKESEGVISVLSYVKYLFPFTRNQQAEQCEGKNSFSKLVSLSSWYSPIILLIIAPANAYHEINMNLCSLLSMNHASSGLGCTLMCFLHRSSIQWK